MQERQTKQRAGTHSALIAGCVILFFALQGLLAPLVATVFAAAPQADGPTVSVLAVGKICHRDAGGPADQVHDHDACCILCQDKARDAALVVLTACASALILPPRGAAPAERPEAPKPRPGSMGWASSWSSRAPPFLS